MPWPNSTETTKAPFVSEKKYGAARLSHNLKSLMATHALIALQSHSSFHAAYLHFDGTPENLRPILHQHFNTIGKINELIQPGALKSISQDGKTSLLDEYAEMIEVETEKALFSKAKEFWAQYVFVYEPALKKWKVHQLATLEEYERSGTKHPYEGLI